MLRCPHSVLLQDKEDVEGEHVMMTGPTVSQLPLKMALAKSVLMSAMHGLEKVAYWPLFVKAHIGS